MTEGKKRNRSVERLELDRLYDLQKAVEEIQGHPRFSEGKPAWDEDKYFRGYVERQLAIVGEAASKLASEHDYEVQDPEIPWPLIKGLRTVLVHVYWKTDKDILGRIVSEHLPQLKQKVDLWVDEREKALRDMVEPETIQARQSKLLKKIRELTDKQLSRGDTPPFNTKKRKGRDPDDDRTR